MSVGACSHSSPVARDKRSQLAFVRQGPAWLRVHMAQVVIKAADNDSIPEPKPSVGEMGTSHEKRMSTSRSQGASVRTDSQRWKVGLPYAVMFGELRLEVSKEKNVAVVTVEFCLKLYVCVPSAVTWRCPPLSACTADPQRVGLHNPPQLGTCLPILVPAPLSLYKLHRLSAASRMSVAVFDAGIRSTGHFEVATKVESLTLRRALALTVPIQVSRYSSFTHLAVPFLAVPVLTVPILAVPISACPLSVLFRFREVCLLFLSMFISTMPALLSGIAFALFQAWYVNTVAGAVLDELEAQPSGWASAPGFNYLDYGKKSQGSVLVGGVRIRQQ